MPGSTMYIFLFLIIISKTAENTRFICLRGNDNAEYAFDIPIRDGIQYSDTYHYTNSIVMSV